MPHPEGGFGNRFQTFCTFEQAFSFIQQKGKYSFQSTTDKKVIAQIGKTEGGDKTIVFLDHGNVCFACWGYRKNCSNTRIGQLC